VSVVNVTPKKKRRQASEWRPAFIAALRNSGNIRAACQAAGIARETVYRNREASAEFRAAWDSALEDAIDVLEATARQRAQASSDTLLIFLLKAHRPEKYRETTRQEISGPGGGPVQHADVTPAEVVAARAKAAAWEAGAGDAPQ
jgi:hypothetical protein